MSNSLKNLTDEQLLSIVSDRRSGAEEILAERYVRLVRICARPFFLSGGDGEDLIQEGMLGLLSAIREYDSEKGVLFRTFAESCIRHRIQSAIRSASRKKHSPLNHGISLDDVLSDESQTLGTQFYHRSPEEQVLARETEKEYFSAYSRRLSKFESDVLHHFLLGLSYQEIASLVGKDIKSVDNAIQRIRRKLDLPPSGDNSLC